MAIDIHWIRDNDSLGQLCAQWQQLPFVALDTEFMRVDTFYPIAALLQIGDGQRAYLIDPLTIDNWQPLAALLENPAVVKVVHACSEDLEVLLRLTGSLPAPLFDTQLAAAYLNLGFSMGYSRLVQEVLGIDLPKGETRSDWLQRPLSETQVSYAAEDAVHLAQVFTELRPRLSEDKYRWVLEDGAELVANLRREVDPYEVYREAKLAWKLSRAQLAVLRSCVLARARGPCPQPAAQPYRARACPVAPGQDPAGQPVGAGQDRRHAPAYRAPGRRVPPRPDQAHRQRRPGSMAAAVPEPLPIEAAALLKRLKAVGQAQAERLGIAPEVMLRKKTLESLLKSGFPNGPYQLPDSLRGWRRELMGQALLDSLATAGEQP